MRNSGVALLVLGLAAGLVGCTAARNCPCGSRKVVFRVSAGAEKEYVDRTGLSWLADQEYGPGKTWGAVGGTTLWRDTLKSPPPGPSPDMYITERYSMKAYRFDVPNGRYAVRLHFIETYEEHSMPGQRIFSVSIQGKEVLTDFDILKEAGGFAKPVVREFGDVEVIDGKLMIEFTPKIQNPAIHGIEIFAY